MIQQFETISQEFNKLIDCVKTFTTFLTCVLLTDSRNESAQSALSELRIVLATVSLLGTRFTAWLGLLDVDSLIKNSEIAQVHKYMIQRAKVGAMYLMSPIEEVLTAELRLTGGSSWVKLFQIYSSQNTVDLELDGEMQTPPLTAVHNLAHHDNRTR